MITGRWLDLASIMPPSADLIFSKAFEKDLECVFTVICNLVKNSDSLDEALEMTKLISTKITQQPHDKPALRLKIMFNLFNLLENPYSRFFVYMKALDLAVHEKVIKLIIPSFKKLDDFLKEWNLGVQDQRQIFLSASNILKECKSSAKDSFKFLTKYLATFFGEDAHSMGETEEAAVRSIIEFLKTPDMF